MATVNGGFATSHPTQPVVERIAGATLFATPALNAGEALVADTRYPVLAVRRDASVDFSEDALFTVDGVVARVTMRVDCVGDPEAFAVIGTPTLLATDRSDGQRAQRGCLRHRRRRHGSPRHGQAHKP